MKSTRPAWGKYVTEGTRQLRRYLRTTTVSAKSLATTLDIARQLLHRYLWGRAVPPLGVAVAMEPITGVKPAVWMAPPNPRYAQGPDLPGWPPAPTPAPRVVARAQAPVPGPVPVSARTAARPSIASDYRRHTAPPVRGRP